MATDAFAKGWSKRLPSMVELTQPGQSIEFKFKGTHCAVYDVVGPAGAHGRRHPRRQGAEALSRASTRTARTRA
jgi:hypothetical protein